MRKRDVAGIIITAIAMIFLVWFIVFGGANPFLKYVNVKVTAPVKCFPSPVPIGQFCWFDHLGVEMGIAPLQMKTLAWWCGPFGGATPIESSLIVEYPDHSVADFGKQSKSICEAKPAEFYWRVPLDKGPGDYIFKSTTCGDRELLGWICVEKTLTYHYGG
jgi:hypothetical protein